MELRDGYVWPGRTVLGMVHAGEEVYGLVNPYTYEAQGDDSRVEVLEDGWRLTYDTVPDPPLTVRTYHRATPEGTHACDHLVVDGGGAPYLPGQLLPGP